MNAQVQTVSPSTFDLFVARQPILDRGGRVFGYELLFRSGGENRYAFTDGDAASLAVISNSFFMLGVDTLAGGARVFVNFTRAALVGDYASVLPRNSLVVEILEDIEPDAEVYAACERLKRAGYTIALDDFVPDSPARHLVKFADIIKVDFSMHGPDMRKSLATACKRRRIALVAEKVETAEDARQAHDFGYDYVQGYYFARPEVRTGRRDPAFRPFRLQLMSELCKPDPSHERIEALLRHDPALSFRLIRYLNSATFGLRSPVRSIRQAIAYLGHAGLRVWAMAMVLADAGGDRPFELVVTSVTRGRFCEVVGRACGFAPATDDLSLLGLFSLIDAIVNLPLDEALAGVGLPEVVRAALHGEDNDLRAILDLARAYERADWPAVDRLLARLGLDAADVPSMYLEAVAWGNRSQAIC
ncbi:MAG: EAL domain-containing protein [Chloroflexi bacterium]|nr:EAL domain-containing protein [Chloroflexota bacterium]